jgi:prepilin-type N-terminal cleavage/methylation domain-containing protein
MSKKGWGTVKGFTLIELLVVVAIIAILAAMILVNVNEARKKARDARRFSDLKNVQTALELYAAANNGKYPCQGVNCKGKDTNDDGHLDACDPAYLPDPTPHIKWNKSDIVAGVPGTNLDWIGTGGYPLSDYLPVLPVDPTNFDSPLALAYAYASINQSDYKIIAYNMEAGQGQGAAKHDGGKVPTWYELYSPGGQWYQDSTNGIAACNTTYY